MNVMLHRNGSSVVLKVLDNSTGNLVSGLLYWPPKENTIYFLSHSLAGANPIHDNEWKKLGYPYSYMLYTAPPGTDATNFNPMHYLPSNFSFQNYGSIVEASRIGESALKMDIMSLRKGDGILCQIMTSNGVMLTGRLFRSRNGLLYMLHSEMKGNGGQPPELDWQAKTGYSYSWQILEGDLRNDCKPETYTYLGAAIQLYDYNTASNDYWRAAIEKAMILVSENVGVRVRAENKDGRLLDGVLVIQNREYYILHDNSYADGDKPPRKLFAVDGRKLPYSWGLYGGLLTTDELKRETFVLISDTPIFMTDVDPMNPVAKSSYDPHSFEEKELKTKEDWHPLSDATVTVKKEEPELIMFKKPTAKVTRCDIQPMQSPQIITKNKK